MFPIEVALGCKAGVVRMVSEGLLRELGFWDDKIRAPPCGGNAMLTPVYLT